MRPHPISVQTLLVHAGIHAHAAVGGFLAQLHQVLGIIPLGPTQLAAQRVDQVAAVDADGVVIHVAFAFEIDHAVGGQEGSGARFAEQLILRHQAGGYGDLAQLVAILIDGHDLRVFINQDAVARRGDDIEQLFLGHITLDIFAVLMPPRSHFGVAVILIQRQHDHSLRLAMHRAQHFGFAIRLGKHLLMLQTAHIHHRDGVHHGRPHVRVAVQIFGQIQRAVGHSQRSGGRFFVADGHMHFIGLLRAALDGEGKHIASLGHALIVDLPVPSEDVRQHIGLLDIPGAQDGLRRVLGGQLHVHGAAGGDQIVDQKAVLPGINGIARGDQILQRGGGKLYRKRRFAHIGIALGLQRNGQRIRPALQRLGIIPQAIPGNAVLPGLRLCGGDYIANVIVADTQGQFARIRAGDRNLRRGVGPHIFGHGNVKRFAGGQNGRQKQQQGKQGEGVLFHGLCSFAA